MSERLLTADEVAALLQLRPSWVQEQTRRGNVPCVRLGRFVRYREEEIREWIARRASTGRKAA